MAKVTVAEPPDTRAQKVFTHGALRLELRFSAGELRQRDVEKLMAAMRRSPLGESLAEHSGKVLRAAVECGWVVAPVWKVDASTDDVADLPPGECRWYAAQVDQVYAESSIIPLP